MSPTPAPPHGPLSRWGAAAALVVAVLALAAVADRQAAELLGRPAAAAVDWLPVWCRARALLGEPDACDPARVRALFGPGLGGGAQAGAYYYPPTTAVLALPLAVASFATSALLFRALSVGAMLGAGVLVAFTAPARSRPWALAAGLGLGAAFLSFRIVRGSLIAGQTGPMLVLATVAVLWAAGQGRSRLSGALAAVAIGFKLLPLAFVPAFLRRRGWVPALVVALSVLAVPALLLPGADASWGWARGALAFADRPMRPEWAHQEPPWVLFAWRWRTLGLALPTVAVLLATVLRARRPAVELAAAFVVVAHVGTVMAGSPQTHEAVVLLPAVGWVLVWPVQRGPAWLALPFSAAYAAYMVALGVGSTHAPPHSLAWVPLGLAAWIGAVLRWGWALVEARRGEAAGPS